MKRVYAIIQDYFAFSRTEMRGLLILLCLTFAGLWLPTVLKQTWKAEAVTSEQDWQTLDSLVALWEAAPTLSPATERPAFKGKTTFKKEIVLTPFDPNQASEKILTALGFPTWIAERIVKYRDKGGKFRIKPDLQKIYGMSSEDYERVEDYILLPDVLPQKAKASTAPQNAAPSYPKKSAITLQPASLNVNTADTAQLQQVSGIGSKLSARIVKYRQQLGGFHSLAQLQEIYHITDDGLANLHRYGVVHPEAVQKININEADVPRLARHPYISWSLAKAIIAHREDYGLFTTLEDVKEVYLMDEILFEKLTPYWVI